MNGQPAEFDDDPTFPGPFKDAIDPGDFRKALRDQEKAAEDDTEGAQGGHG